MGMRETEYEGAVPVDGYGPGFFRIGGVVRPGPVIVTARGPVPWGGLGDAAGLTALAGAIDVLFLGVGAELARPDPAFMAQLEAAGLAVELMTTPTAARSYNVTLAEGRRVACALVPV